MAGNSGPKWIFYGRHFSKFIASGFQLCESKVKWRRPLRAKEGGLGKRSGAFVPDRLNLLIHFVIEATYLSIRLLRLLLKWAYCRLLLPLLRTLVTFAEVAFKDNL